jgi:hypothetical protein
MTLIAVVERRKGIMTLTMTRIASENDAET